MTIKPTLVFIATFAILAAVATAQDSAASSSSPVVSPQPPASSSSQPIPGPIPPPRQQIMPDVFAIFSACSSDVERVCASMQPDTCLEQLRVLYTSLSDTCKTTLDHEFPCIRDAATHCAHTQAGWPLMNCLASISAADVSPRCASWLDAVRAQWMGEAEPAIAVLPAEPGYPHTGGDLPPTDEDEEDSGNGNSDYYRPGDEDNYHHNHHGRHHWKKHHGKMLFALAFVALIAGAVGACCGMCCMRRRMMRGGEGCCRRACGARCGGANRAPAARMAPQFAGATNIPLHHVPSRGPMQYAVMSDEVVPASAV